MLEKLCIDASAKQEFRRAHVIERDIHATFLIDVSHNLFFRRKESVPLGVLDLQKKELKESNN